MGQSGDCRVSQQPGTEWSGSSRVAPDPLNVPSATSQQGAIQPLAMGAMTPTSLLETPSGLSQPDLHQAIRYRELKRKAFTSDTDPRGAKRSRAGAASRKSRRGSTPLEGPQKGSLNGKLHARPRERLFVHPFEWTGKQLEVLQLAFKRV